MSARFRSDGAWLAGACALLLSFALGSHSLAAAGIGLTAAGLAARAATLAAVHGRAGSGRRQLTLRTTEGAPDVLSLGPAGRGFGTVRSLHLRLSSDVAVEARPEHGALTLELAGVPRGRYALRPAQLVASDPLGLARAATPLPLAGELIVRPDVPVLTAGVLEGASWESGTRRRLRSASGLDVLGVREHVPGEPLRSVHWPTTARRGTLMVRELAESRRVDTVVALDTAGAPPPQTVDVAVRAAGALLRATVAGGRRGVLVRGGRARPRVVESLDADWEAALDELAGVGAGADALPGADRAARGAGALLLVTTRSDAAVAAFAARTGALVVHVRPPGWRGLEPPAAVVVRPGEELGEALARRAAGLAVSA